MLDQKLSYVVKATDENDRSVENHQRVEIAINLPEFPMRCVASDGLKSPMFPMMGKHVGPPGSPLGRPVSAQIRQSNTTTMATVTHMLQ